MSHSFADDDLVSQFHESGLRTVISVTGGGSGLLSRLLGVSGGSNTIIEANIPYSEAALAAYLQQTPDQSCSANTALSMAAVALHRARKLTLNESEDCIGLGLTASLVSNRPKRGEHRIHAAIQTPHYTELKTLMLNKGVRTRAEEEAVAASLGFSLLASAANITYEPKLLANEHVERQKIDAAIEWNAVRSQKANYVAWNEALESRPGAILSGSFNPRHFGHDGLRLAAADHLNEVVGFELPIVNADKPPLDDISLAQRLEQFHEPVVLTGAATFVEKSNILPETVFVIGIDTAVRVLDERFYPDSSVEMALNTIRRNGCRFLVAARHLNDRVTTIDQLQVPTSCSDLFDAIPPSHFLERISSTELRAASEN